MKIDAIIQARTTSTRLPQKVLKELPYNSGITILEQVLQRTKCSTKINNIIVATTNDTDDSKIVEISKKLNVKCFRGSKNDVLSRYYFAAKEFNTDVIIRITGDCPCISPKIIDMVIDRHLETGADYTTNSLEVTFPRGFDVEVINFTALEKSFLNANTDYEREHVSPYIYNNKNLFKIENVRATDNFRFPDIRITVDTEEDYAILCCIYDYLYDKNTYFEYEEIINLFKQKPWLKIINKKITQKKEYKDLNDELADAIKILGFQELNRAKDILKKIEGQ